MSADRPKILLADDSVTIRKVVELTFADEGIDVVSVADGDAAMTAFVADQPDLVIADVNMPGVGGYKICEIIKEDDETRHIPVILLTGSFEPFDPGEASRVGANFYFTKPFQSIRDLVEKVTDLLDTNAFEPARAPETEDIDDLYKSSFADTLKIPANETSADIQFIRIEDDDAPAEIESERAEIGPLEEGETRGVYPENLTIAGLGYQGMDDEVAIYSLDDLSGAQTVETEVANIDSDEVDHIFSQNLTAADLGFEGVDHEFSEHDLERVADEEEREQNDATPREIPTAADPFSMPVDLGDASMDDEMIETSRPDEPLDDIHFRDTIEFEPVIMASLPETAADPFSSPVTTDDTMAKYNWADETEGVVEQTSATEANSTLLKIEFAESDHEERHAGSEPETSEIEHDAPEAEPEADVVPRADSISPELIEMIAQRVIDKLSDKIVREVALEAVPRITENMIREALDHETKK